MDDMDEFTVTGADADNDEDYGFTYDDASDTDPDVEMENQLRRAAPSRRLRRARRGRSTDDGRADTTTVRR